MKAKFTILLATLAGLMAMVPSCTKDFEEINRNPNFPEAAPINLLLTNILQEATVTYAANGWNTGNGLAQYTAKFDFNDHERYDFASERSFWRSQYLLLRDVETLIEKGESTNNNMVIGIGYTIKALLFSQITNLWGDVPYFNALQGKLLGNFTPEYDTQEQIYTAENGLLDILRKANTAFTTATERIEGDVIYGGNKAKWHQFSNSLRLRLLLRISKKLSVGAEMQEIINSGVYINNNTDNFQLLSLPPKPNQWYYHPVRFGDFNLFRMSNTIDSVLTVLDDPRIHRWFAYTEKSLVIDTPIYRGMPVGMLNQTRSNVGLADLTLVSRVDSIFHFEPDEVHHVVMNVSEVAFTIAEAAARGLVTANAQEHYEKGITMAFSYWKVAMPNDYLSRSEITYNATEALKLILTQKWLANFNVGFEGWLDYKRTGLPALKPVIDNTNGGKIPSRFYYPGDEQSTNKVSLEAALKRMGGSDDINYNHWWE